MNPNNIKGRAATVTAFKPIINNETNSISIAKKKKKKKELLGVPSPTLHARHNSNELSTNVIFSKIEQQTQAELQVCFQDEKIIFY